MITISHVKVISRLLKLFTTRQMYKQKRSDNSRQKFIEDENKGIAIQGYWIPSLNKVKDYSVGINLTFCVNT